MSTYIAASILFAAGLVLVALGLAFPLAVAIVEERGLAVSAADLALAEDLSAFWPAFVGAGVAGFAAALGLLIRQEAAA